MTVETYELVLEGLALLTMYPMKPPPLADHPEYTPLQVLQDLARTTDGDKGPRVDLLLRKEGYGTLLQSEIYSF